MAKAESSAHLTARTMKPYLHDRLKGKVAVVTGAGSGIGQATAAALVACGARVIAIDRDQQALEAMVSQLGPTLSALNLDLLKTDECGNLMARVLELTPRMDIFHANAGAYLGGDLTDAAHDDIDRVVQLNLAVVMKNVRDAVVHMKAHGGGDILVTSSLAAHYPTPWEPVYASTKWAIDCFVQTTRRQVRDDGIRIGAISPGPVATGLLRDWSPGRLEQAKQDACLLEATEIAEIAVFMLTRPTHMTIRDVIAMPTRFDL